MKSRSFKTGHLLYVSTVFDVLSRFCLCEGFPVVAKRTAKDARGNIVGPPKNGTVVMIPYLFD